MIKHYSNTVFKNTLFGNIRFLKKVLFASGDDKDSPLGTDTPRMVIIGSMVLLFRDGR
jgi:hypothetical protein